MKGLLDKGFIYKPSFDTDIEERFNKVRARIKAEKDRAEALIAEAEKQTAAIEAEAAQFTARRKGRST